MNDITLTNTNLDLKLNVDSFLNYIDVSKKTIVTYQIALKQFIGYLYQKVIKQPNRDDIIAYREHLKEYLKPTSVNSYMIAVRNLYKWMEYEEITKDITKNVKGVKLEQRHLKRGLSKEEIQKVLSVCKDTREELIIKLMITCALRVNEVVNIQLEDFYDDKGTIMLRVLGKGRDGLKQDSVKIDERIYDLIKKYIQEYKIKDYLFVSTSRNNNGGMLTTKTIRLIVTDLFKKAGLDMNMISQHSCRHSSCEILLQNGMPINEVSDFMRHKNIATTMIYSKELNKRESIASNIICDIFSKGESNE